MPPKDFVTVGGTHEFAIIVTMMRTVIMSRDNLFQIVACVAIE